MTMSSGEYVLMLGAARGLQKTYARSAPNWRAGGEGEGQGAVKP